jgi:hypothetical protein
MALANARIRQMTLGVDSEAVPDSIGGFGPWRDGAKVVAAAAQRAGAENRGAKRRRDGESLGFE